MSWIGVTMLCIYFNQTALLILYGECYNMRKGDAYEKYFNSGR